MLEYDVELRSTADALVVEGKGILAADESLGTIGKRFGKLGIPSTAETHRAYRDMLFTTEGIERHISGIILYDETIRQRALNGTPFVDLLTEKGIIPGIKVDTGALEMALHQGEKITYGLDGLRERLEEYKAMGARFAKWRAVITIGSGIPSTACVESNANSLARYAAIAQEVGLVPIVEPEVLMDGDHDILRCKNVTSKVVRAVFGALDSMGVLFEGMLLKPNMVVPGLSCLAQGSVDEVAQATLETLLREVPAAVPGVVFLSGGQSSEQATARLNAMNARKTAPWQLSFSFGRALQEPALTIWHGGEANVEKAQAAFYRRCELNGLARSGSYSSSLE